MLIPLALTLATFDANVPFKKTRLSTRIIAVTFWEKAGFCCIVQVSSITSMRGIIQMPGTRSGGLKAAATNKFRYGLSFYEQIGRAGGKKSRGGGFSLLDREFAAECGRKGGEVSRRGKLKSELHIS